MRSLALLMKLQLDGIFRFSEFRYAKSGKAKIAFFLRSLVPLLLAFVVSAIIWDRLCQRAGLQESYRS